MARRGAVREQREEPSTAKDAFASFWENGPSDLVESKADEVDVKMEEDQPRLNSREVSSNSAISITLLFLSSS